MGTHSAANNACGCRAIQVPVLPTKSGSNHPPEKSDAKYFQEIGAEMIGNQLIIRVEKDKNKSTKRKAGQWDPPCDCSIPEIRMPSSTEGPKIMNAGDNNQILFRIRSGTLVGKEEADYKSEAFAYQLGSGKKDTNDQHRSITVHPNLTDPARSQEVHSDHITDGNQNIYLLRIKKKGQSPGERKRNIELELRTPKPPTPRPEPRISRKLDPQKISQPEVEMKVVTTDEAKPRKKDKSKKKKKK